MTDYHDLFHLTRVHSLASFFLQVWIKDTCINKMIDLENFGAKVNCVYKNKNMKEVIVSKKLALSQAK